jgi:hypothetical protein
MPSVICTLGFLATVAGLYVGLPIARLTAPLMDLIRPTIVQCLRTLKVGDWGVKVTREVAQKDNGINAEGTRAPLKTLGVHPGGNGLNDARKAAALRGIETYCKGKGTPITTVTWDPHSADGITATVCLHSVSAFPADLPTPSQSLVLVAVAKGSRGKGLTILLGANNVVDMEESESALCAIMNAINGRP